MEYTSKEKAKQYAQPAYDALDNFTSFIPYEEFYEHLGAIREVQTLLHKYMH